MEPRAWSPAIALRDLAELIGVFAFVILVPPVVEQALAAHGISTVGSNRVVAIGALQVLWAGLAAILVLLNGERLSSLGMRWPERPLLIVVAGLSLAAVLFAVVVTLENLGYGRERLGEIGTELRGNTNLLLERVALSVFVVGFVEEFMFRGFIMSRLANILGGSRVAWTAALVGQAVLFGLTHGYQQFYGMALTGVLGLLLGGVYLASGRNLWIVVIGHGCYDGAHAAYLSLSH
jgi:membrane protease YdiL (CAAX protease family)